MFFKDGNRPIEAECCGCSACVSVCPKSAISMTQDKDGFLTPEVNYDLCIECGLCEKVCPMKHGDETKGLYTEAYMAINKHKDELLASSSGGIFSAICDYVLNNGGVVYGAAFDTEMKLHHIKVSSTSDLAKLRGSKYVQSDQSGLLQDIKKTLNDGSLVYYSGTGCQVAALKLFLRKDYPNLLTSDILCHGVPPQRVFDYVISYLQDKYAGRVVQYNFRDKTVNGWSCSSSSSIDINGKIKYIGFDPMMKAYFNAFLKGSMYRESCYNCPFATKKRSGDITLGDYWGVKKYHNVKDIFDGVSAIIINTDKGREILNQINRDIILEETDIADVSKINKTLLRPSQRPNDRNEFFYHFQTDPEKTLLGYVKHPALSRIIFSVKHTLSKHPALYSGIMNLKRKI